MVSCRLPFLLAVTVLLQPLVLAQTPSRTAALASLAQPRVPDDPLELTTGEAQPVQNAEQRLAAVNLPGRAHTPANVRAQPYHLKTTFTVSGSSSSDGVWNMEDVFPSSGVYRWTAQGPSYSVVALFTGGIRYSTQPSVALPLRLAQVRAAIFAGHAVGAHASVRTATAALNGADLNCVLIGQTAPRKQSAGARLWEEAEYCADAHSGALTTWSPAPGVYVHYDYSNALSFHGKAIPGGFTITEAGRTVVDARVESVTDPGSPDPALFDPSALSQTGVGSLLAHEWHLRRFAPFAGGRTNVTLQAVVVHGMLTPGGELTETEVVASSSAHLNRQALDLAAKMQNWHGEDEDQPGATPQEHEVFLTVQFAVPEQGE